MSQNDRLIASKRMQLVKSKGTSIEKAFARILRSNRTKYCSQPDIIGHPDFRIKATNVLVFCDSSFWHGRNENEITGKAFKTNRKFWVKKLQYNKARDVRISRVLRKKGWIVLRFWDNEIIKHPSAVISKLNRYVEKSKKDQK
jgi:DNA mismatch endonuclease (patch repair protein)